MTDYESRLKILAGTVATFIVLKALLEGSAALPPPTHEWLAPPHAMGAPVGVGDDHLPDHIHYSEASDVSGVTISGSPTGTATGHSNLMIQIRGEPWVF